MQKTRYQTFLPAGRMAVDDMAWSRDRGRHRPGVSCRPSGQRTRGVGRADDLVEVEAVGRADGPVDLDAALDVRQRRDRADRASDPASDRAWACRSVGLSVGGGSFGGSVGPVPAIVGRRGRRGRHGAAGIARSGIRSGCPARPRTSGQSPRSGRVARPSSRRGPARRRAAPPRARSAAPSATGVRDAGACGPWPRCRGRRDAGRPTGRSPPSSYPPSSQSSYRSRCIESTPRSCGGRPADPWPRDPLPTERAPTGRDYRSAPIRWSGSRPVPRHARRARRTIGGHATSWAPEARSR